MRKKKKKRQPSIRYESVKIDLDLSPDTTKEIVAIILGLFALFFILSFFNYLGTFGKIVTTMLFIAIGYIAYFIPAVLVMYCLNTLAPDKFVIKTRQTVSIILTLLTLPALIATLLPNTEPLQAGGYLGFALNTVFQKIIGPQATLLLIIAILIICFLLFFNTSLFTIFSDLDNIIRRWRYRSYTARTSLDNIKINGLKFEPKPINQDSNDSAHDPEEDEISPKKISKLSLSDITDQTSTKIKSAKTELKEQEETEDIVINWTLPPTSLLEESRAVVQSGNIDQNVRIIEKTLAEFGIDVEMKDVNIGPTVTQYTFKPHTGVKLSKITSLQNDLALALAAHPIRVEAPIPGKSLVGIEIPNKKAAPVRLKDIIESEIFNQHNCAVPITLGRDISGQPVIDDLTKMPHLLIAGSTGSGKSVFINCFLATLLCKYTPDQMKLILVDPKRVELSSYNNLPHLLTPVVTEAKNALSALKWGITEMTNRYKILSENNARNIASYNQKNPDNKLPYIVIVIDELADLMMTAGNDIETTICRLAQMARATGIHLIVATQRPSVDVITGLIKANIATRIAFAVASQIDSRTILDMAGAEKLLGKGDMLYISRETGKPRRIQGVFVSDSEIDAITQFWKNEGPPPKFSKLLTPADDHSLPENLVEKSEQALFSDIDDDLFQEVVDLVLASQQASASFLQRKLKIGYARAARLIDILEQKKIISAQIANKPRQVLIKSLDELK